MLYEGTNINTNKGIEEFRFYSLGRNIKNINKLDCEEIKQTKKIFHASLNFINRILRNKIIKGLKDTELKNSIDIKEVIEMCHNVVSSILNKNACRISMLERR